jgi:hypothetical protein
MDLERYANKYRSRCSTKSDTGERALGLDLMNVTTRMNDNRTSIIWPTEAYILIF